MIRFASLLQTGRTRCWALIALACAGVVAAFAEPLPAALLARKPEFVNVQLSPDGTAIAYRRINDQDLMSLEILDLATGQKQGVAGTENFDVGGYTWINDRQLGVILTKEKIRGVGIYVYDRDSGRLAAIKEGGARLVSVPKKRKNRLMAATLGEQGVLVELTTAIDMKNRSFSSNASVEKANYPAPPLGRVSGYAADVNGEPILGFTDTDTGTQTWMLNLKDETWRRLPLDMEETPIQAVAADRRTAWVTKRTPDGGSGLFLYDLEKLQYGKEMYHEPDYDVGGGAIILSRDGKTLRGLQYGQVRAKTVWFDEGLQKAFDRISTALQGYDILLIDRSDDEQRAIFMAKSSTEPGQYFLADLKTGGVQHVAASAPWLDGVALSPTASFNYEARDGLKLQAYLTLPTGGTTKKPYPLMVLGHGGPWARDTWNYDPEVQFLASRGYAVVQPNYRGSTGFNAAVSEKDRFEFRKMHDDVTDAVKALINGGIADADRVGIMGASFGGYLAIAGAAWEPDLYRVAITNVGVFDWDMLISDSKRESYSRYYWMMRNVGNDPAKVEAFSPLNQVDDIKIPVFIAAGRQDIRVDISQSVRLERALKARGIPHETYFEGDSGHGFAAAEAQQAYLEAVDKFLTEYFPVGRATVSVGPTKRVD